MPVVDLRAERFAGSEDVLLAQILLEAPWTHAVGKRPALSIVLPGLRRATEWSAIEQAHTYSLCRAASNSAIEQATAALSDSTLRAGTESALAAATNSEDTPFPSPPTTKAEGTRR